MKTLQEVMRYYAKSSKKEQERVHEHVKKHGTPLFIKRFEDWLILRTIVLH